ncbi:serine/threonine-protein phosphatase [Streptomyces ipomoeae]|jgi:serine phosphatase RsbU (regulator of sigma subunit)|uniref:Stage II sporulation protein E n=2 Tax=Streptomyces ipomoeae TaxID=103232 RepID=L1KRX2_9ACTN|nr:PP2C family protein-serine/threonine phosphatase [Streptomyces ipomoeae]EKX63235.1 stage II sporulation protein E [Streptomyces ipomoeae 91-03]MDX2695267.1 PP2C family protein-serine/threonine phosphatase [Streptomyces ipomoeae]MDX2823553.1 PP2C family protein-serine/threonine phosphatase [Streptomyces ipomoeae]MDX2841010.1 PP2C family protein-serine/threonine phosphatase [Streptomyces ipomoeae]MDX2875660.1 PP2C family protein-serine/threonine phosphatase [Streptomyces ipomoeae]
MSRTRRTLRRRPAEVFEAIEPPGNGELVAGVVSVTVFVEALGALSGSEVWLLGLLVFLPGAASALCTEVQTRFVAAWTALVVTATVVLRNRADGHLLDRLLLVLLTLALALTSVYACRRRIRREHEMVRLRSTAAAMQRHILHPLPLVTDDVLVNGVYEPLHEDRLVGGDIYDVVDSPFGTRVLIGDVQGKGLAAVGTAFAVIGAFREAAHREPTLTALVDTLDAAVVRHNSYAEQTGEDERFVTALIVSVDADIDVQVVNCGHIPPRLLHEGAVTTPSLDSGVPLGLAELASEPTTVDWFDFPPGATLLLTTDGLTEIRGADGTFYPVDERLMKHFGLSPTELPESLYEDARAFASGDRPHDDIAVLTVRRSPLR